MYPFLSRTPTFKPSRQLIFINYHSLQSSPEQYANYIEIYGRDRALSSGKKLHGYLIITGLAKSTYLASKLITFYTQCGEINNARKLFDKIPETSIRRWVVMMGAYSRQGFYQEAVDLFVEMKREGLKPNKYILPSVLKACANLLGKKTGESIHGIIFRSLCHKDVFVDCSLIDMYSKCGQVDKARFVFDKMLDKDLAAWNCMVSSYAQNGFSKEAMHLVEEMKAVGVKPDLVTWNALIAGFSQAGDDAMTLKLFEMMQANGNEPDVISWTSVISGLVRNFRNNEAFNVFKNMMSFGVMPCSFTISTLIAALATVGDLIHGKEIHGYAVVTGVGEDVFVCSSLLDMYSKGGSINEARKVFNKMSKRNTVTWNAMIFGCANHGRSNEALELFNQMIENGKVKPDHLTFIAALTACSHAGMVEVGRNVFCLMQEEYVIQPRLEHYACLVDLLGRAGELTEAYNLIKSMPMKPDSFVWGAFLGACRNHKNIELAEIAAKSLYELEPGSSGSPLLLSNMYADVGNWGSAERLKKMMKKRRMKGNKGCSWVETV